MTIQTIVFDSAWLTRNGLVAYQLDGSEEDGGADANDLDPARHRPGCFRERLLRRSDPFVEALHVNRLAHSCNTRLRTASGASRPGTSGCRDRRRPRTESRSEEHTSELQSLAYLVCRLLLEKKNHKET